MKYLTKSKARLLVFRKRTYGKPCLIVLKPVNHSFFVIPIRRKKFDNAILITLVKPLILFYSIILNSKSLSKNEPLEHAYYISYRYAYKEEYCGYQNVLFVIFSVLIQHEKT